MSFLSRKSSDPPTVFATYLLPSNPFRRSSFAKSRHSSTDSASTTGSTDTATSAVTAASTNTSYSSSSNKHLSIDSPSAQGSSNPFSRCPTPVPVPRQVDVIEAPTDKYLHGHTSHIQCSKCATDLCLTSQIISKGFQGRHGRAYLISGHPSSKYSSTRKTNGVNGSLPNTFLNKPIDRNLVTGQHKVSDVQCNICGTILGWKYVEASEEAQKYKVGKFILETKKIRVGVRWDNIVGTEFGYGVDGEHARNLDDGKEAPDQEELEFDSQSETECQDLFENIWSPGLANRRRQRKAERYKRKASKVYVPRGSQESLNA